MVTAVPNPEIQQFDSPKTVILMGVSWQTFMTLLTEVGEDRATKFAYDKGVLEIRMPLIKHEIPKGLLESFIEAIADELEIEVMKAGALSLKREDLKRFIEPDSCFYIQNEALMRAKDEINLPVDPSPDLAIESDFTSSSLNKFTIYASLEVPEIWRYQNQRLQIYQLIEGEYQSSETSLAFPFLPIAEVAGLPSQSKIIGQRSAVREFRKRIREILDN